MHRCAWMPALLVISGRTGCSKGDGVTGPPASNAQWTRITLLEGVAAVVSLLTSGNTWLAGTSDAGVFGSTLGGLHWAHLGSGPLANTSVWALAVPGTTLLAATEAIGIWRLPL